MDLYVKQGAFPGCFVNGLSADEAAALAAEQRPLAASALSETLTAAPAWTTIPSWAIIGTADHVLPPAEQLAMATRAGAHITEINAPHRRVFWRQEQTATEFLAWSSYRSTWLPTRPVSERVNTHSAAHRQLGAECG